MLAVPKQVNGEWLQIETAFHYDLTQLGLKIDSAQACNDQRCLLRGVPGKAAANSTEYHGTGVADHRRMGYTAKVQPRLVDSDNNHCIHMDELLARQDTGPECHGLDTANSHSR